MNFFGTFRGRLLLILTFLLFATLGIQYYLNLLTQRENDQLREMQERTLSAGIAVGIGSLTSNDRVQDLIGQPGALDEAARDRIRDIIIVDDEWQIYDCLNEEFWPVKNSDGSLAYRKLAEMTELPPIMEGERLGEDVERFPTSAHPREGVMGDETHVLPIQTSQGRWYVLVVLRNDPKAAATRAVRPLVFTLGILLVSTVLTMFLVWRFTRPIAELSDAAREVAEGNFAVRVPGSDRSDEIGQLTSRFNEMTSELEKKSELEAKLQQAEKSAVVGRLGSAIAHEIRNPLNYINLTLDHLRSKFSPEETEKRETFEKLTSQLKAEVARINQQISDFLNYSRPAKVNLRPISPRDVIDDSIRIIEGVADEKHIKISVIEQEGVSTILGDPEFLRSVFSNLFINAVQAIDKSGGRLNVRIVPDGPYVRFEVTDTGSGIAEENLEKIFEPYFSTKETGTGLGLAIVKKIVDVHHGMISVESNMHDGTRFTVRLPGTDESIYAKGSAGTDI